MNPTRWLLAFLETNRLPAPELEFRFAPPRRWRFDLAWPARMLALEIQGGGFIQGRHTRGVGQENDCEKFSTAAVMGWRVMLVTPKQIKSGVVFGWLQKALENQS